MVIVGPLVSPEDGLVKKLENVTMKINQIQMNAGILYVTEKWVKKKQLPILRKRLILTVD